jgi:hypothetical protein
MRHPGLLLLVLCVLTALGGAAFFALYNRVIILIPATKASSTKAADRTTLTTLTITLWNGSDLSSEEDPCQTTLDHTLILKQALQRWFEKEKEEKMVPAGCLLDTCLLASDEQTAYVLSGAELLQDCSGIYNKVMLFKSLQLTAADAVPALKKLQLVLPKADEELFTDIPWTIQRVPPPPHTSATRSLPTCKTIVIVPWDSKYTLATRLQTTTLYSIAYRWAATLKKMLLATGQAVRIVILESTAHTKDPFYRSSVINRLKPDCCIILAATEKKELENTIHIFSPECDSTTDQWIKADQTTAFIPAHAVYHRFYQRSLALGEKLQQTLHPLMPHTTWQRLPIAPLLSIAAPSALIEICTAQEGLNEGLLQALANCLLDMSIL